MPPDAKVRRDDQEGREVGFNGIARRIERYYRRYRQRGEANSRMEAWLDKVMVEKTCPDCNGARVRADAAAVHGRRHARIYDLGQLNFDELHTFLGTVKPTGRGADAGRQVLKEIRGRPRPAARHRARLPELQPAIGDALRRRVAADPAVHADRLGPDGDAVRARRAEHRPASQGQHEDDRDARKPSRHRQHRHRRGARRGHDPRRRSPRRDGPRPGRPRRQGRRAGHAQGRARVQGLADRPVPLGQAVDRDTEDSVGRATARCWSCAARARTTSRTST